MTDPIPEQMYLDAAGAYIKALRAYDRSLYGSDEAWESDVRRVAASLPMRADLRAAVESAYRAGYGQGRDDEALDGTTEFLTPGDPR